MPLTVKFRTSRPSKPQQLLPLPVSQGRDSQELKGNEDIKEAIKVGSDLHHPGRVDLVEIDFQLLVIDEKPPLQELSDEEIGKISQEDAVAYIMGMRQQWAEKDAEMDRQHAKMELRSRSGFLQGVMNQLSSSSTSSS